jgi:hypothetical protein
VNFGTPEAAKNQEMEDRLKEAERWVSERYAYIYVYIYTYICLYIYIYTIFIYICIYTCYS